MPRVPIQSSFELARCEFDWFMLIIYRGSTHYKYIINRGSRSTRRMTIHSSLALFIFYLDSLEVEAQSLLKQVSSALSVFEVEVVTDKKSI